MNGRVYDPLIGRFLSPDMYVQLPGFSQSFNRYSYCLNNPLKYTDPDGESIIGAVIIGAIIGAYSGGVLANEGQFNPIDWDWESSRTWGYMAGGMITGALSGAAGAAIASSGIPMANTLSIMGGSLTNSLGTYAYTGGQTDITMSFGFASYNFTQKTWGCLGKEGNSTLDNIGYAMGALGNISDLLVGSQQPKTVELQTENNPLPNDIDPFGHSQIVDLNGEIIIDFGPQERGQLWGKEGRNNWVEHASYDPNLQKSTITQVKNISGNKITEGFKISGINGRRLANIGFKLDNNPGRYILGVRSCSNVAARALTLSGAPMVGLHPYLLHIQAKMWSVGIRPWTMSNYNFNY